MNKAVLIVEDNRKQADILEHIIEGISDDVRIFTADNLEKAYGILMEVTIDVFLIDIILDTSIRGDTSGIKLARMIRTIPKYQFTPIIFVTSLEDPEMYAYKEIHCLEYIEKPFDGEDVRKKIKYALNYTTERKKEGVLTFRNNGIFFPVRISDIVSLESVMHRLIVYLFNGESFSVPYKTCQQILDEADTDMLIQCSRSAIVNRNAVRNIDLANKLVTVVGNRKIVIGNTFLEKVRKEYEDD